MKHHSDIRKLGRTRDQRRALMRSLIRSLLEHGHIRTTEARAKEMRPAVEKLVTKARTDTLATRRLIAARVGNETLAAKLVKEIAPQYKERAGGYTRIVKLPRRQNDASKMARIEFV